MFVYLLIDFFGRLIDLGLVNCLLWVYDFCVAFDFVTYVVLVLVRGVFCFDGSGFTVFGFAFCVCFGCLVICWLV